MENLSQTLSARTQEAILYEKLPDKKLRCFACGHRCLISDGLPGICKVRFNKEGVLYAPTGYVGALQCDPIEKKPFFHALPGVRALSFGMLGCDFHCAYCFTPEMRIATSGGAISIKEIVSKKMEVEAYSHAGVRRKIKAFFERPYHGPLLRIKPAFLAEIRCTPEHPFLTRLRPDRYPQNRSEYLQAERLTRDHCLVVPKHYEFSQNVILEPRLHLQPYLSSFRVRRKIQAGILRRILELTKRGKGSQRIAETIGKSASHVRHLRSKIQRGEWNLKNLITRKAVLIEEGDRIRFSKEHAPGIPKRLYLTAELAELFGFYCAEGSVSRVKNRVHSAALNFSFGRKERDKAERVKFLIGRIFGVRATLVQRETTLAVSTGKSSLAILFKALCGERGTAKQVPEAIFRAKRHVAQSFLSAYVAGDGYRARDGQIRINTVSEDLAWGVAWLVQKLGYLPQFYQYPQAIQRQILGRSIQQAPRIYLVRWYEAPKKQRHHWEDENYHYVLIEEIKSIDYNGPVYNLETEGDHTYLAGFVAAHNCQNWITSQAIRDPEAIAPPQDMTPKALVDLAFQYESPVLASTYNEPLITSEWAVDVFRAAKSRGLKTAYISNGNGTSEVLDFIRPWVDLYKVDLKSFRQQNYQALGGRLEVVLETIRQLKEKGFWLEIVTLTIPGFNDSDEELTEIAKFLVSISKDIPWHVTGFHKDYKMTDPENTPAKTLIRAAEIGAAEGLHFVYAGNLPGKTKNYENTFCPKCRALLIERWGYRILQNNLKEGRCPSCKMEIPGVWK